LNFYVACETYEDVPYILNAVGGNDNIVIGTDYSHGDRASVMNAHKNIIERSDIDQKDAVKITSDNGRALYGL
jgi:microsomal dipeptidase-like Zn-dependent dipeptidase